MPDFASRRLANTSCVLLPMDETMPIPVTTTRRILLTTLTPWFAADGATHWPAETISQGPSAGSGAGRLQGFVLLEQADFKSNGTVDHVAIRRKPAVGNAENEFRTHDPLDVDTVDD